MQSVIEARSAGLLAPTAMPPGPRSRRKSAGAAAAGALLCASPSPLTVHRGGKGEGGGQHEQQEVEEEVEEEVPSQDMWAQQPVRSPFCHPAKPATGQDPVAAARPAVAAAAVLLDSAAPTSGRRKSGAGAAAGLEWWDVRVVGGGIRELWLQPGAWLPCLRPHLTMAAQPSQCHRPLYSAQPLVAHHCASFMQGAPAAGCLRAHTF
jgi:hypothetical protein